MALRMVPLKVHCWDTEMEIKMGLYLVLGRVILMAPADPMKVQCIEL